jgi:hypothetical protein
MLHRFRELEINPNMYLLNWLMALYTKSLPLDLVRSLRLASILAQRNRSARMPIALSCPRHALTARVRDGCIVHACAPQASGGIADRLGCA